ncbi:redoxin [Pandoraea faecigallinarum]|uniref:Redoxin n=1 Tax=Pandoraea faecigallinarum TaxID=656179 RepID=A0A0H3WUJ6_9BURK|nr:TlpA disulfide reductase family protein [Pandoraea faecigallinarum]AKM30181.1 redoxin [Pandoraea faecigallinarum]
MIALGPFPMNAAAVAAAAIFAWLAARYLLRKTDAPSRRAGAAILLDAVFVGLFAARAVYVLRWWPDYAASPLSIVAIGDGGFDRLGGPVAALAWALWRTRRHPIRRRPIVAGMLAGVAVWGALQAALTLALREAPPLPALTLSDIRGRPMPLERHLGKPIVMNLWASWCPPCRREMPVLAQAQTDYPDVQFLMINQGEAAHTVAAFVQSQGLTFDHLLLDPDSQTMRAAQTRALPTTLYFDPTGRLVDAHLGELSAAGLRDVIHRKLRQPSPFPASSPRKE